MGASARGKAPRNGDKYVDNDCDQFESSRGSSWSSLLDIDENGAATPRRSGFRWGFDDPTADLERGAGSRCYDCGGSVARELLQRFLKARESAPSGDR